MDKVKSFFQSIGNGLKSFWNKTAPFRNKLMSIWRWAYRLRNILLTVPVAVCAVILAVMNMAKLPENVMISWPVVRDGMLLIQDVMISKLLAVFVPLTITAFCLLMVIASKRMVYPWLISVFSLILPLFFFLLGGIAI